MTKLKDMTIEQLATIDCKLLSNDCENCILFKPNENLMSASRISGGVFRSNCLSNYFEYILEKFGDIELPVKLSNCIIVEIDENTH